jgi:hypothetical protein
MNCSDAKDDLACSIDSFKKEMDPVEVNGHMVEISVVWMKEGVAMVL